MGPLRMRASWVNRGEGGGCAHRRASGVLASPKALELAALHDALALAPTFFQSSCGLVAMTSASHAEGRQFDPGQVYFQSVVGRMVDTSIEASGKQPA